jgi:tetratricopeptide (TPR) repeat protein
MTTIPFEIPDSLNSYVKTFEESPEKGISNLVQYLGKRRNDAVGYFLLAILYTFNKQMPEALKAASKARALAPGSHLLENLHYFLCHPDGFKAWTPEPRIPGASSIRKSQSASTLSIDLDILISRLSRAGSKRITITKEDGTDSRGDHADTTDQLATPTLAGIYESQNKLDEAIKVYERLMVLRPKYESIYEDEIKRIRAQMN